MNLKRIIGSHFANYREAWEANRLIAKGKIHPTLSRVYSLAETGQAAYDVHRNLHQGKVGVLCLAPEEGLGVRDQERGPGTCPRSTGSAMTDRSAPHAADHSVPLLRILLRLCVSDRTHTARFPAKKAIGRCGGCR